MFSTFDKSSNSIILYINTITLERNFKHFFIFIKEMCGMGDINKQIATSVEQTRAEPEDYWVKIVVDIFKKLLEFNKLQYSL